MEIQQVHLVQYKKVPRKGSWDIGNRRLETTVLENTAPPRLLRANGETTASQPLGYPLIIVGPRV